MTSSSVYIHHQHVFIIATLLLGLLLHVQCVTYELTATPKNVVLGQSLRISARLINPSNPVGDVKISLARGEQGAATIFDNLAAGCRFFVQPYIRTGTINQCDKTNHRYTITFPSVTEAHIGSYRIGAPSQTPPETPNNDRVSVQLLVKPTSVVVSPARRNSVAGQSTSLTCTVDNKATIPVIFVWKRIQNGNRIDPSSGSTATTLNDQRNNELKWTSVDSQDGGQYECQASNAVGSVTSTPATLVVYYAADSVTLTASTVSVGTSVSVTCSPSGGKPRPGLVIYDATSGSVLKELVQSSGAATLTFTKLTQKSDNGAKYACRTKVNVAGVTVPVRTSNTITLVVQFPPKGVDTPKTVDVDEGQIKSVRCQTTSSSNPETKLTWSGPVIGATTPTSVSEDYGMKSTTDITVTGDRTRNGAIYTCTATYLGQQVFTPTTTINVNFAPGGITLYDTPDRPILENKSRVMKCRSETSRPAGTITWRKLMNGMESVVSAEAPRQVPGEYGGTVLESEITINATRQDNGAQYWCEVDHTYSNGTKVVRKTSNRVLDVHYPVDVSISISPGSDIQEGDPVTLTCDTSGGNPQTVDQYSWSYNGTIIPGAAAHILSRNPIRYDQGGRYSCSATNKGGTSSAHVSLNVKYKPRLDPTVPHQSEVGVALGGNVTFTLTVLSNPSPSGVQWSRNGAALGKRFTPSSDGLTYTLQVTGVVQQDYGDYTCRITNSVGSTNFKLTLKAQGPPETNTEFGVKERTSTSLTFEWRSGFSGATNQTFLLEIERNGKKNVLLVADPGNGLLVNYTVKDLEPGTEYSARVRSRNDLQLYSEYTTWVKNKTKANIDKFDIKRDGTTVTITWAVSEGLRSDYWNATVHVAYTPADGQKPDIKEAEFRDGKMTIRVEEGIKYTYNITVKDGNLIVLHRCCQEAKVPQDPTMAVAAAVSVVILLILVIVIIVLVILHRRGILLGACKRDKQTPTDDVEGTTNEGYLGSIDGKVEVSTPALSPYVEFPPEMRSKRVSVVDKVKQRLSAVSNKSDQTDSKYGRGKNSRTSNHGNRIQASAGENLIIENQHAETSYIEDQKKPPTKKKGFAFLKGKTKGSGQKKAVHLNTPGESNTDNGQINPYGTTSDFMHDDINPYGSSGEFANEGINPYGTTNAAHHDDINPYGTTDLFPPPRGAPIYADVNKPRNGNVPLYAEVNKPNNPPATPLYAEVDKSNKPPPPPIYAEVDKSKKPPAPPIYAEVDKSKKPPPPGKSKKPPAPGKSKKPPPPGKSKKPPAPPAIYAEVDKSKKPPAPPAIYAEVDKSKKPPAPPAIYAEVDKSKKSGFSVPDNEIYAEVNLESNGPSEPEETYANLSRPSVRQNEPVYANTSGVVPQREQPTTHAGVDGIIYTDLVFKPDPNKPKPKPKPKPEETIYAEIDLMKSTPPEVKEEDLK